MASTYTVIANNAYFGTNKSMIALFNTAGSGKILRVYRVWVENNQVTPGTGIAVVLELRRITAASAGTTLVPVSYDSTATALGTVTAGTGMTVTVSDLFKRIPYSTDEPTINTGSIDEFQQFQQYSSLHYIGLNDSRIEPIVCREGEGVTIRNITTTTVMSADFFIEFTVT
jgi:hypothetical protein